MSPPRERRGPSAVVEPLWGSPLLVVRGRCPMLVAADVHVGLAFPTARSPRPEAGSPVSLAGGLLAAAERTGVRRVLFLGDVKDPIVGLPRHVRDELLEFFGLLREGGLECELVLGNHDAGIARALPPEVVVHAPTGVLREGVGYFHGHSWPSSVLLRGARTLVVGHLHPGFRLAPSERGARTGKERCWVRTRLPELSAGAKRRRRRHPLPRAREIVVLPAYNPLCASEALNREEPRRGHRFLVRRFLCRGSSRAYLLDGTDLGELTWESPSGSTL